MTYQARGFAPDIPKLFDTRLATPIIPGTWMAVALALNSLAVIVMMARTSLVVAPTNLGLMLVVLCLFVLGGVRFWARKPASVLQQQLRDFSEDTLLFALICLLGILASYPEAAGTTGFADPALAHMDQMLHFDWTAWYRAVSNYPALQRAGTAAYAAIYVSPLLLLGHFAWTQKRAEARRFLLTFWVAAVLTLLLFPLFPAEGPLAFLWHGPIPYMPTSALYQAQIIPALRAHTVTDIEIGSLRGLICAPSFHTVSAVLYVVAAWPVARLRWVLGPLNVLMLLATPIEGTHYLTDMIVGLLVALCAIFAVRMGLHFLQLSQTRLVVGNYPPPF